MCSMTATTTKYPRIMESPSVKKMYTNFLITLIYHKNGYKVGRYKKILYNKSEQHPRLMTIFFLDP